MTTVRDCMHAITTQVDLVPRKASVEEVIRAMASEPITRAVFVVDERGRLMGQIDVREILRLLGARYIAPRSAGYGREIMSTRAEDLMGPVYTVAPGDNLEAALKIAVQHEIHDIPVVEDGKVVGILNCLEIITAHPMAAGRGKPGGMGEG